MRAFAPLFAAIVRRLAVKRGHGRVLPNKFLCILRFKGVILRKRSRWQPASMDVGLRTDPISRLFQSHASAPDGPSRGRRPDIRPFLSKFCENPLPIFRKWWFRLNKANDNWQLPFGFRQPASGGGVEIPVPQVPALHDRVSLKPDFGELPICRFVPSHLALS